MITASDSDTNTDTSHDPILFGWDPTPGIVSVWAHRDGRAVVWRREGGRVLCEPDRFRPWVLATSLADVAEAGPRVSYRQLDGPEPSYRYLLSAATWRILEQAILDGAARRIGQRPASVRELDGYYGVGPIEQYLMLTGRTYYRGLAYDDLHRLQLDLETTALDPAEGRIFMVACRDSQGLATTLEAANARDERQLIRDLVALIRQRDPDVIENHNLFGFDLPFLASRAARLGVALALGRPGGPPALTRYPDPPPGVRRWRRRARYTVAGRELVDTLDAVRRHDFVARDLPSHGLKDVARHFGVAAPERTYLPGAAVYATFQTAPETVRQYAQDDVAEVDALSRRLHGAPFALAGMAPRRLEHTASAGLATGILEPLLVRAYLRAGAAPPYGAARGDEALAGHTGGALHLFATGVAQQVVKADIASMYPSLMGAYGIGPACDRLGVLLHVVEQMTALRLAHKDALRGAAPGTREHGHHDAMQAAMKLLINSAYGYMAAGTMALFADRRAADEVTRRGREVLGRVVDALGARGMALIEADTDGVYFAAPQGWTEDRERALVAAVAAELPDGVRLEYEGRFRAMLSHEVKNYALLGYDGRLVVRGVAMRSSRSEPFGERFLRTALAALLAGDVAGMRSAFVATVGALESRALPAADVAARVRLSKSPADYLARRETLREAGYEALLAAGRTEWTPGERVRCFRVEGGGYAWLPDDARARGGASPVLGGADDRRDYDVAHYRQVLVATYAGRLRRAFAPEDFSQLFRVDGQPGLFDRPVGEIEPLWVRCEG